MLRFSIWVINLLILFRTILAKDTISSNELHHYASHDLVNTSRTGRFGFDMLEDLRQSFCQSSCTSADKMPYLVNLMCALKCPDLYLPHHSTTPKNPTSMSTLTTLTQTTSTPTTLTPTSSSPFTPTATTPSNVTPSTNVPTSTITSTSGMPESPTTSTTKSPPSMPSMNGTGSK